MVSSQAGGERFRVFFEERVSQVTSERVRSIACAVDRGSTQPSIEGARYDRTVVVARPGPPPHRHAGRQHRPVRRAPGHELDGQDRSGAGAEVALVPRPARHKPEVPAAQSYPQT
eukprot:574068-Prorocentrum_minimum.AAC.1